MPDTDGALDGSELGWDDGIDVGQSDTEGLIEGWPLRPIEGSPLGRLFGLAEGTEEG